MEKYLFKKIYWALVTTASVWYLNHNLLLFDTPLPVQCDRISTSGRSSQEDSAFPSLPTFHYKAIVSAQKVQATRISHPVQLCDTGTLFPSKPHWDLGLLSSSQLLLIKWWFYSSITGQEYWVCIDLTCAHS